MADQKITFKVIVPKSKPFKSKDGDKEHYVTAKDKNEALRFVVNRLLSEQGTLHYIEPGTSKLKHFSSGNAGLLFHILDQHQDYRITEEAGPLKKEDKVDREDWKAKGVRDMKSKPKKDDDSQMKLLTAGLDRVAGILESRGMRKYAEQVDEISNTMDKIVLVVKDTPITLEDFMAEMVKDVEFEYAAAVQYIQHAAVIDGANYDSIRQELFKHAREEMEHAKLISEKIAWVGGTPGVKVEERAMSNVVDTMLRQDLFEERRAIGRYKERIAQAEQLKEYGIRAMYEDILLEEEEHEDDLITALGIKSRDEK